MANLLVLIIFLLFSSFCTQKTVAKVTSVLNLEPNDFTVSFGNEKIESFYLKSYMPDYYSKCTNVSSIECQGLLNGCILSLYQTLPNDRLKNSVCDAYSSLQRNPSLELSPSTYNDYISDYLKINPNYQSLFTLELNKYKPNYNLIAAEYNLKGQLINNQTFNLEDLVLCNTISQYSSTGTFPPTYLLKLCELTAKNVLNFFDASHIKFIELFLKFNGAPLIPLPVRLKNDNKLYHRFLLYDTISAKTSELSIEKYARYAKDLTLVNEYIKTVDGKKIYLPYLEIEYSYFDTQNTATNVITRIFVQYTVVDDQTFLYGYIFLGVLSLFAFIWAMIKTWNWNRRSGKFAVDCV